MHGHYVKRQEKIEIIFSETLPIGHRDLLNCSEVREESLKVG